MCICLVINKTNVVIYSMMCIFCKFTQFGVSFPAVFMYNTLPGMTYFLISIVSVSAFLFLTLISTNFWRGTRSTIPRTHIPSTLCPLWYFCLPNFDSSISTITLGPPICVFPFIFCFACFACFAIQPIVFLLNPVIKFIDLIKLLYKNRNLILATTSQLILSLQNGFLLVIFFFPTNSTSTL
ncbi:hypothetical protein NCER_102452 [Vairimorpha ceranae BRL01]|uniref:Uncharacterized protein n=1 Tax=Vairimorpha ceranae (strain BRL01) TaxID=578460 RepID=C4VC14_VAIC1|nr:hypothetical protein NCER_102452 [Vairimorpha ceranae BRL01]